MLNKIIIVYLNFLLLVAGISVIFLAVESGDHQIIYAQVSISPEGYPEGHPLAPPQGSPQETSPGIPPNSQIPSLIRLMDTTTSNNSQIPFDGSPDGIRGIPPNSQIPPSSQGTPTPPTNTQVPPTSSQPQLIPKYHLHHLNPQLIPKYHLHHLNPQLIPKYHLHHLNPQLIPKYHLYHLNPQFIRKYPE